MEEGRTRGVEEGRDVRADERFTAASGAVEPEHATSPISDFDAGFLVGLLVGEGHFGGDARQPQITLRMHTDHAAVFRWLLEHVPGGRLYGPYHHSGRHYYQWMARGPFLRTTLVPLLDRRLGPQHSERVHERYQAMKARYRLGTSDYSTGSHDVRPTTTGDRPPTGT